MSVLKESTNVHRTATTTLVHTPVAAMLVTVWTPMGVAALILMNVRQTLTDVLKTVKTLLARTLVAVILAIGLMQTDTDVMVSGVTNASSCI